MSGLDEVEYAESDSSDNEEQHSKLLVSISQLDSTQRVKPALRKELASKVSEYHLTKGPLKTNNLVNVNELAQVLKSKSGHVTIAKKFRKVTEKSKTLPKPLEKPVKDRLTRSIGFENIKKQLRRWDAIVTRNALQDHLVFPLNDNSMQMQQSNDFLGQFKSSTSLEKELAKVLQQDTAPKKEEEDDDFPLTLEEMMEKRKEMAQLRAKLSYKEAKAQRQSKIKSKKYHRILKREKLRQKLKEFELLQKTDPEAALKKLSELDKSRAQERASLRHRNTGQWAKNLTVRAKYDVESRKVLAEQLKMSREITQKVQKIDSSDEEISEKPSETVKVNGFTDTNSAIYENNPWCVKVSGEVADFVTGYRKYWDEKNKETNQSGEEVQKNENEEISMQNEESDKNNKNQSKPIEKMEVADDLVENKSEESRLGTKESKINEISTKRSKKKKKCTLKNTTTFVTVNPASGVWIITPVEENENETAEKISNKNEQENKDIDSMFENLNKNLLKKAEKKLEAVKSKLKSNKQKKERKYSEEENNDDVDLSLKTRKAIERPDMDEGLLEGDDDENVPTGNPVSFQNTSSTPMEIDPKNFVHVKPKKLNTYLPDNETAAEDAVDDEEEQRKAIEEAFVDDDVVVEFKEMKAEEEKTKEVEMFGCLPGWGEWGGVGIEPNQKKKRRLMVKVPPRKDHKMDDMIINENENPNLKCHLVKEVPHPFKSVEAFEANIRAPVGRDWVPETAHRKLIQKPVETKLGAVIEPMREDEIVRLKKKSKSPYKGKNKNKAK